MSDRRRFLDWFLGTSLAGLFATILYPVARFVSPPRIPEAETSEVDAGFTNDPELLAKGFKIVRFGVEPVILLVTAGGDYRAFTAICTHLDCIVDFRQDRQLIWCWCHNGVYDLEGKNIGGPPPRPLTPFEVRLVSQGQQKPEKILVARRSPGSSGRLGGRRAKR